jgi:putative DNA primase/helicase
MNRAPLTVEEQRRRAAALHQHAQATQPSSTVPKNKASNDLQSKTAGLSPIEQWQIELAREAHEGRGVDALHRILLNIKCQLAGNDVNLLAAVDEIRECAERHLVQHEPQTVDAIFRTVFPNLNGSLDAAAINLDADKEIQRLASLSNIQYERERTTAAANLGMRTTVLDSAVKAARPTETKGQGRAFVLSSIEPWPSPVSGAELLDEISAAIGRYVVMSPENRGMIALWALHSHCFDRFSHSPRLAINSPEKNCGKSTTLDVLGTFVARPFFTANATSSVIFRIVEMHSPTLLIDEADTFLDENLELRGILNSGHRRGGQVARTIGDDHEPRQFSTWAPAAIAKIGRLPDTLNDRSLIVSLRRRKASEKVDSFRSARIEHLTALARKMARWAQDHGDELAAADPDMGELVNRVADNWCPLFAIADEAGGHWPALARKIASVAIEAAADESINALLFADIKSIFDGCLGDDEAFAPTDRLASATIVERLTRMEGRPWGEWKGGKPITQNGLARLLGKFEVLSGTIRLHSGLTAKGYYRSAFNDVFARYLPPQTVTTSQLNNHGHCVGLQSVTPEKLVTLSKTSQLNNDGHCDVVTVSNPRREAIEL